MEISSQLVERVKVGKVALFLGSGALYGATLPAGRAIPLGNDLRDILCDKFLNDSFKDADLAHVSAMAISQSSLVEVQDYIATYLQGIEPAEFHKQIPLFNWRALFTTNYDLLIENSYRQATTPLQELQTILSNQDSFDETRKTNNKVPYFKLHGCVTRTHDKTLPLILTTDQYNDCLTNRNRLFTQLYELAYENTLVFVGHSLQDHNIRKVLLSLEKEAPHGQRHYLLKPGIDSIERDFWAEKKISALDITFEKFITDLSEAVTPNDRLLSLARPPSIHPIQSTFNDHLPPSEELIDFLTNQIEWINSEMAIGICNSKYFFKGISQEWSAIAEEVPIRRKLQNEVFANVIELPDSERNSSTDFYVVKGEAGSGKSVFLRQLAWQASNETKSIVLWVREGCIADVHLLDEIISKANERVFLFWDDAASNATEINRLVSRASSKDLNLTIITAERYNEWNVRCEILDELVTGKFELTYLSENEIDNLVLQLEKHDSLGPNLIHKNHKERCLELKEIHARQLLVALHEATMGEPFEDIIFNEYQGIYPESAKKIYLTVCTLNRLRVPVRAGLISRIHDVSFSEFTDKFYKPLEKVVIVKGGSEQDVHYYARHSEIAEIVFRRALYNSQERYIEYINIINKLNISFSSDKSSFRHLLRAKSLLELFPNHDDIRAIYSHAWESIGDDPYLLQQMANYERLRPSGNLTKATEFLIKAMESAPYDQSILHSLFVLWRDRSSISNDLHEKSTCRREARGYLDKIISKWGMNNYVSSSLIELSIEAFRDIVQDDSANSTSVQESIRKVQHEITENKRQFPTDGHIHSLEAKFAHLINDHARAISALEKSFEENDREPFLAIRLADSYVDQGEIDKAKKILQLALDRRRADHRLNYHYAELLRNHTPFDTKELLYFYRRGFTPNDSNYQAQFWYARYAYSSSIATDHGLAMEIFNLLRKARLPYSSRVEIRDYEGGQDSPKQYIGTVDTKRGTFGFLIMDGTGDRIFFPANSVEDDMWEVIREGDRLQFNVGYSYTGVVACNIKS